MEKSLSLVSRAVVSISLLIAFYLIAFSIAGILFAEPYIEYTIRGGISLRLTAFCIIAGGIILWSIIPRIDIFEQPGILLSAEQQPTLFTIVSDIASQTGQTLPREIYVTNEMNAWVTHRGGFLGLGSKKVLGIGLPLVELLTDLQFKAVLAHEFGHFYSGDTKLGPIIYKTRSAIIRTIASLARYSTFLHKPFELYLKLFLRITHAVSRSQELVADRIAAQVFGSKPLIDGLQILSSQGLLYEYFIEHEIMPAVSGGFIPPLYEGFRRYLLSEDGKKILEAISDENKFEQKPNPYDTHPTHHDRIQNLMSLPENTAASENPAEDLFNRLNELKAELVEFIINKSEKPIKKIEWKNVGTEVWGKRWKEITLLYAHLLADKKMAHLPLLADDIVSSWEAKNDIKDNALREEQRQQIIGNELGVIFAQALIQDGWHVLAEPGEKIVVVKNDKKISPFDYTMKIAQGHLTPPLWQAFCDEYGLSSSPLLDKQHTSA